MATTLHPSIAVHAGCWVREELVEPSGLSVTELAERLGVARQALVDLLHGHAALTRAMAVRLEGAFQVRADTLMDMQCAYDRATARGRDRAHVGPRAVGVDIDPATRRLLIALDNGALFAVPWDRLQGLAGRTADAVSAVERSGDGHGLHWPALDVDFTVPGLLAGRFGARGWAGPGERPAASDAPASDSRAA